MTRTLVFVNSLFPCLSETFVYDQFLALHAAGLAFHITSNNAPDESQVHPRMRHIQPEVHYLCRARPREALRAHGRALLRHPLRYLGCLLAAPFAEEKLRTTLAQLTGAALLLARFGEAIHLHAHFTYGAAGVVRWAKRLAGVPYSLTLHGSDLIYDFPADLAAKLGEARAIVSISRFNIDYLRQHFPAVQPERLDVIPLGVPPLSAPVPRPPRGPVLRILNVGRLSEHKAQHDLVSACALLARRGVPFQCDIVGEGPKREPLAQQIAALGLQDSVRLLGPRFHHEVLELYGHTDLFVLCSITEGMPIVLMEAMRAGVPLIATRISAIPELIQDGGLLVPPSDPEALAEAIQAVAEGRIDSAALSQRGPRIIAEYYDLARNHQRFADLLRELCAR